MNTMRSSLAALFGGALLFTGAAVAPAQSVVTEPVGFTTLTVAAKPPTIKGFTYLSLNMFRPTAFRGAVTSATAPGTPTTITFPANSFTANQFTGAGNVHFLEITNGSGAGVITDITATTTNSITVSDDVAAFLTAGTSTVRVRPHWTFATVFGANNSAGLLGGTSAANSDTIQLVNPTTGIRTSYFYSTSLNQWRTGFSNANDIIIPPDAGLIVERKVGTPVSFTLTGEVKLGPTEILVVGGGVNGNTNVVPNPYPLGSVRLQDIGLYNGNNPALGFVNGTSATSADTLGIFNPATGIITSYFVNTSGAWRTGFSDATNFVIPEGASFIITRRAGRPTFSWFVPQPTMNL